ncbi:DNA cytosine methyltransferase [Sphingobium yanoikuyae]|uniref:DNA cytosine methyltransferase n=1 Tax=Sphingobium yanoikuyae TaxID=13690 RepID=UPI0004E3CEAE|nr:DNA cytosine methyltransferase [Sphingobium yanoikuyae]KFD26142.1 DNA methyltransferase [Sphingobium yanoikuyae]MDV3480857.1 DNA cytosine methyltransferase [Sphingobium yanoikuyae]
MANEAASEFSAISLFSGAGGMDVGVRDAGYQILLANDIDPAACATYRLNHGDVIVPGTVVNLLPLLQHVKGIDLVFGGPPCQGFSVAGKMDPTDPRSSLIFSFFDAVDAMQPRAFICENVKALAALSRWSEVRDALMLRANQNYHACLMVLTASDFGVPQNRERMFIVGIRKDLFGKSRAQFAAQFQKLIGAQRLAPPTLGQVIRALGPAGSQSNSRVCRAKITYAKAPVMRRSPYAGMMFNGAGRPLRAAGRASTLPASMGGNKTPFVDEAEIFDGAESFIESYHASLSSGSEPRSGEAPARLRRLTIDECLAIQTFPSSYKLSGSQSAMYRQIGNAVPCRLAFVVSNAVKSILMDCNEISEPTLPTELLRLASSA